MLSIYDIKPRFQALLRPLTNYLADAGLNSLYFLPMNLGGDGQDTSPFLDQSSNGFSAVTHYDVGRMEQWNLVFEHAQRRGLLIELVQYFLPHRQFSLWDLAADMLGLLIYPLGFPLLKRIPGLALRWISGTN